MLPPRRFVLLGEIELEEGLIVTSGETAAVEARAEPGVVWLVPTTCLPAERKEKIRGRRVPKAGRGRGLRLLEEGVAVGWMLVAEARGGIKALKDRSSSSSMSVGVGPMGRLRRWIALSLTSECISIYT